MAPGFAWESCWYLQYSLEINMEKGAYCHTYRYLSTILTIDHSWHSVWVNSMTQEQWKAFRLGRLRLSPGSITGQCNLSESCVPGLWNEDELIEGLLWGWNPYHGICTTEVANSQGTVLAADPCKCDTCSFPEPRSSASSDNDVYNSGGHSRSERALTLDSSEPSWLL